MAATVIRGLSAAEWAGAKPADYKGQELDKALKAYEAISGKSGLTIPGNLIPKAPNAAIGEIETCIKDLTNAISELQKGLAILKQAAAALQAVQSAATKASGDLTKMAKDKGEDKAKYENAAARANGIGSAAGGMLKNFR